MYLSDRDFRWALQQGQLIIHPSPDKPNQIGPTSIDLHLERAASIPSDFVRHSG
jgi:deoxycytidine triphosphate deaminase